MTPAPVARPAAPYIGGKRNLAGRLAKIIDAMTHRTYVEPFVGMGGVFLRRRLCPAAEVVNDASADVATFFRILQRHYPQFMDVLRWQITGRAEFERLRRADPSTLTDLERAARFLYLQRTAFGGKVAGRSFGVSRETPARFNVARLEAQLGELHERLAGVIVEQLPYAELIRRYDGPGTLFYLDPPYHGCERDYGEELFRPEDFARLADLLGGIAGRFVLSINDTPAMRAAFGGFRIEPVDVTYSLAARSGRTLHAGELIVSSGGGG